jgi:hypothetical protein
MPTRAATLPSCGPEAACGLRREAGYDTALYDPFFHPDCRTCACPAKDVALMHKPTR